MADAAGPVVRPGRSVHRALHDLQHRHRLAHRHGPEDIAALDNPYDVLWDTQYAGKMAILDDWHTAMGMVLLRNGQFNINSTDSDDIAMVREQLLELRDTMKPRVTISMYTDLPAGQYGLCQMWSGDAINTPYYLPETTPVEVMRFWFPEDGKGEVDNDLVVCLAQGENPVAAHFFLNELLDPTIAGRNFGFTGYQPPLTAFTPDTLVADGYVPENLRRRGRRESDFTTGVPLLQLPAAADAEYHRSGRSSRRVADGLARPRRGREPPAPFGPCSRCPARSGWPCFFVAPLYVVLAILFGGVDPILRAAGAGLEPGPVGRRPVPLRLGPHRRAGRILPAGPGPHRVYVGVASVLCLLIAYPVAYYTARFAGRWKGVLLAALIAPFWISYMMRMLAWVNLLQTDGLVDRSLSLGGRSTSTSTGSAASPRPSYSGWSTATCPT